MSEDIVEPISKISGSKGVAKVASPELDPLQRVPPNKDQFDSFMHADKLAIELPQQGNKNVSLMDTVRDLNYKPNKVGPISNDSLIAQTNQAVDKIEEIKQTLQSPDIHIKSSVQDLLNNKLNHIDDNLKIALSRTGTENNVTDVAAAQPPTSAPNPIEHFLNLLEHGQSQLENIGHDLHVLSAKGEQLTPINMLAVQVKVGQIQQELTLFDALLNQALQSVKTLMNTQV